MKVYILVFLFIFILVTFFLSTINIFTFVIVKEGISETEQKLRIIITIFFNIIMGICLITFFLYPIVKKQNYEDIVYKIFFYTFSILFIAGTIYIEYL